MITVEFDCPFEIGDRVYFEHTSKEEKGEIECPFCHGNSTIDTGLMHWSYDPPLKKIGNNFYNKPLILTCKNCDGEGVIRYRLQPKKKYIYGVVNGIAETHYGGWQNQDYLIKSDDGHEYKIQGWYLCMDDEEIN